jgi:hypothetical protein
MIAVVASISLYVYIGGLDPISIPQVFYTYPYNHARRPRLEKLQCYIICRRAF